MCSSNATGSWGCRSSSSSAKQLVQLTRNNISREISDVTSELRYYNKLFLFSMTNFTFHVHYLRANMVFFIFSLLFDSVFMREIYVDVGGTCLKFMYPLCQHHFLYMTSPQKSWKINFDRENTKYCVYKVKISPPG